MRRWHVSLGILTVATACSGQSVDVNNPVSLGAAYVQQRGCGNCHGEGLAGVTTPRPGTQAYPANLTPDHETGIGDWAGIEIVRAMRFGIDDQGATLCPPMPRFDTMSDLEANAIVAWLRTLPPVKRAIPESQCAQPDGGAGD